jgi:ribonucleoside-diphosphate reductase alpha chain
MEHARMNLRTGQSTSPFTDSVAVEAWDAWFRWREGGELKDFTVDATWERVASALVANETQGARAEIRQRLLRAFSAWQLLPDERILASAGTQAMAWRSDDLVASLNIAGFVKAPCTPQASLDIAAFEQAASLAVRALDNAALLNKHPGQSSDDLQVGVVGFADALALLGIEYGSAAGVAQARRIACALADGCLAGTVRLARDRNPIVRCDRAWAEQAALRGVPRPLIDDAVRFGLRHNRLTAITSQPRLALFANDASDALDPKQACLTSHLNGERILYSRGLPAGTEQRVATPNRGANSPKTVSVAEQLEIRGAMQPWIDEPIAGPVRVSEKPDAESLAQWGARAAALDLGLLRWSGYGEAETSSC